MYTVQFNENTEHNFKRLCCYASAGAGAGIARTEMSVRPSVRLSVCPSHSDIVSKRPKLAANFDIRRRTNLKNPIQIFGNCSLRDVAAMQRCHRVMLVLSAG